MIKVEYKDEEVFKATHIKPWHPKLIELGAWIFDIYDMIITEGYREGDKGVHGCNPLRGIDLRAWTFKKPEAVYKDINKHWVYNPTDPAIEACVLHARCPKCKKDNHIQDGYKEVCECGENIKYFWHFHIQAHNNTELRNDK